MISVEGTYSQEWDDSEGHVSILRGHCRVKQGSTTLEAQKMVLWRSTQTAGKGKRDRLTIYLEDDVRVEEPGSTLNDSPMIVTLSTRAGVHVHVVNSESARPGRDDALYVRADKRRRHSTARIIRTSQIVESPDGGPELRSEQFLRTPAHIRRIHILPRSGTDFAMTSQQAPNRTPPEQVTIITGGVNVRIEGLDQRIGGKPIGMVELSADRMVIWSRSEIATGASQGVVQSQDEQFEIYMEGNIIIRQGDPNNGQLMRECKAEYATFDARDNKALLLNAELKTYLPSIQGTIRVWAERLRQLGPNTFHGTHVWSTTSPYGKPGVRVQSTDVFLEERERQQSPIFGPDANEPQQVNPATGEPDPQTQNWITSLNNVFFVEDVPLFYLPYISAPADKSEIPLQSILFSQDSIFGTTIRTMWDPFKLFGFMDPKGAQWSLLGDYFSRRGPAVGLLGKYKGENLFGIPGKYFGEMNSLYVHDVGTDDLGADRPSITPSTQNRGIFEMRHEQQLPNGFTFIAEAGWQSDRNFQDSYFQSEFDRGKDIETLLYLKQQQSNWAWTAIVRPNDQPFEYETQWLPRGDLYVLSQPLFNGLMTYSQHTSGAYAEVHLGDPPSSQEVFTPISYFAPTHGADLMTRQQLDAPFSLGPINIVPHVMGEAAYWGDSFNGEPVSRLSANLGLKSSMEMWRAFPEVQSDIFNLNGLAHKIVFETDYEYTSVNRSLSNISQWNELDDNAQERFQRAARAKYVRRRAPFALRPAVVRSPHGGWAVGHHARQRTPRRSTVPDAGRPSAVADQGRPARSAADPRLDDARPVGHVLPRSRSRRLRRRLGPADRALRLEHQPADHHSGQRPIRHLHRGRTALERGHAQSAERAGQRLPRTGSGQRRLRRARQRYPHAELQLSDEHEVDLDDRHGLRLGRTPQRRPVVHHLARSAWISSSTLPAATTSARATPASRSRSSRGSATSAIP